MLHADALRLIATLARRRPGRAVPSPLEALFARLAAARGEREALDTEDRIWAVWMAHDNEEAETALDRATSDIAAQRYDIAETRLARLVRRRPDYAEAWHKLGTLHYLRGRDDESLAALGRALALEPRHFAALGAAGEIFLSGGEREGAALAFRQALRLHPHMGAARERLAALGASPQ